MRIAFVTNICSHYRVKTFETLARYYDTNYYFFSAGDEWYWQQQHGIKSGNFKHVYLSGFRVGNTRVTPSLARKLLSNDYDVYIKCINGKFALPITYLVARLKRRPFILWTGIWMRLRTRTHRLLWPLTRYIYQNSDAIVTYGEHVKSYLMSEGISSEKIFVASHALDNDAYNFVIPEEQKNALRSRLNVQAGQKVILYLGRLELSKGINFLIEAFSQIVSPELVLVIAGTGREEENLRKLVSERKVSNSVRFTGYVPVENTPLFYSMAYTFVLSSITMPYGKEPWGLVVNEAFNQGVPVVVTDAVGAAAGGLVENGINGFIVPERDSIALAQALEKLISAPTLRDQMGINAKKKIATYDNERMVRGFRSAIEYVLQKR